MEKENRNCFSSPVIQTHTPIKRLGLSRKRKSCGSECDLKTKSPAFRDKFNNTPCHSSVFNSSRPDLNSTDEDIKNIPAVNYLKEIKLLKEQISADETKLKTLQENKANIKQLEDLIEVWKNGCKNAFLHFSEVFKEKKPENINFKDVITKLGIWDIIVENFDSDSEMGLSDYSQ